MQYNAKGASTGACTGPVIVVKATNVHVHLCYFLRKPEHRLCSVTMQSGKLNLTWHKLLTETV